MAEIFKLQLPLMTNGEAEALIYNEGRDIFATVPITEELEELFDGELKIYVYGRYNKKTRKVEVGDLAPEQPW